MPNKKTILTTENLEEWMHSTGYLLPRTSLELARFESLHRQLTHEIDCKAVDPFAIINGTWKLNHSVSQEFEDLSGIIDGLRMAARKHSELPDDIIRKIKNNHKKNNGNNSSGDQE